MLQIITCFYNGKEYLRRCLNSLLHQSETTFQCFLIDDKSNDGSLELAESLIGDDDRFILRSNQKKTPKCETIYKINHEEKINEEDIIIILDGDDWLIDDFVLEKIKRFYLDSSIMLTYGSYLRYRYGNLTLPSNFNDGRNLIPFTNSSHSPRVEGHFSHLKTWKNLLFRKIKKSDLIDSSGVFFKYSDDVAYFTPMLEMAGPKHTLFIPEHLYCYNTDSNLNTYKLHKKEEKKIAEEVGSKNSYDRLSFPERTQPKTKISICVAIKNRTSFSVLHDGEFIGLELFEECLDQLFKLLKNQDEWELCVCDFGSTDVDMNLFLKEKFEKNNKPNFTFKLKKLEESFSLGKGRNTAASLATGSILFFMDADMFVKSHSLFDTAIEIVHKNKLVYFPICFSYTDPNHNYGYIRIAGRGNVFLDRNDFAEIKWVENSEWGGEDDTFFDYFFQKNRIYRTFKDNLDHQWHPENLEFKNRFY